MYTVECNKKVTLPLTRPLATLSPQGARETTRGFTLIELLVVVLIIGILAAVALPQYNKAVRKAQGSEVMAAIESLDKALSAYYLENSSYKGANADTLNVQIPDLTYFQYRTGYPGNSQYTLSPSFQTGSIPKESGAPGQTTERDWMYVLSLEKDNVQIRLFWEDGKLEATCKDSTCDNYVPCNWVQVGTEKTCYLN